MADRSDGAPSIRRKRSFQGHQYRRKLKPASEQYSAGLVHVAGLTLKSRCAFSCDEITGNIAFPAGCVIVVWQIRKKKQFHIFNPGRKQITCLQYSTDGQHLVTGESGHLPCVRVFSVSDRCQVASFQSHKYGVSCVAFAPSSKYIVSIGYQHDNVISVYDWKKNGIAASNKVSIKVRALAFAENSSYFVTAGNRHVKFWYIEQNEVTEKSTVPLKGRSAILGTARNHMFCDVVCGLGYDSQYTFTLTRSGMICRFNAKRVMDNCTQTDAASAFCMCIVSGMIVCGCAESKVLLYSTTDLGIITVFNSCDVMAGHQDVIAVSMDSKNMWLHCVHANHSLNTWDLIDFVNPKEYNASDFHSECIWDVQGLKLNGNDSSFYTCSNDSTVRMWSLTADNDCVPLKSFHLTPDIANTPSEKTKKMGVRSLCVSEDGKQLAIGDRSGVVHIYEMSDTVDRLQTKIKLHDGDILCLDGDASGGLLASASRDRCIHMLDCNGLPTYTINDHSAAVTAVKFVNTFDRLRLISCSIDKSLYFCTVNVKSGSVEVVRDQHIVGKHAMHDMAVVGDCVLVACGSALLEYDIKTGKNQRTMKTNESSANILRVTVDRDSSLVAVSCADKFVYILSYQSGDYLMEVSGHAEVCTALQFLSKNSDSFLISASADSCIFVWKLSRHENDTDVPENVLQAIAEQTNVQSSSELDMTGYFGETDDVSSLMIEKVSKSHPGEDEPDGQEVVAEEVPVSNPFAAIDMLNTSLPTWITGKTEKTAKARVPGGKWAGRLQEDDQIILYEDIHANQTLLDTPNTTQQWDSLEDDDDIIVNTEADADSPCLSIGEPDAINNAETFTLDLISFTNATLSPTETEVLPLNLPAEDSSEPKTYITSEADAHFNSMLSQTSSGQYVSACEESDGESDIKFETGIGKSCKTPTPDKAKNLTTNGEHEQEDSKIEMKIDTVVGPGGADESSNPDTDARNGDVICTTPNRYATVAGISGDAIGQNTFGNHGLQSSAETFERSAGDGINIKAVCNNETVKKNGEPPERLSSGDGTHERLSDEGSKPIPPAFANFLDTMAKKRQRTPRSLPVLKVHEQNFINFSGEFELVKSKPFLSKEVTDTIPKSSQVFPTIPRSATGRVAVKQEAVTPEISEEEAEEIVKNLTSAFEKAENLYQKVTSNGYATDPVNDSVRAMLSGTFTSLQSRMSKLGILMERSEKPSVDEVDSPAVLAMLKEYSDKLLGMMENKLRNASLVEK